MFITSIVARMLSVGLMVLGAGGVFGQSYPNKPIRIVTGAGAADFTSRLVAQGISSPLGQTVVVENRPSAGTAEIVANATPDGYTVLISGSSIWLAPLTRKVSYDPVRDLAPISLLVTTPYILVVHPSLPVKSVKELIAYAKARPGELSYSSGPLGGGAYLAVELFKSLAGVNIVAVPYSANSSETQDLISGRVQLTMSSPAMLMAQVKSGKLKALAVSTAQPSAVAPDLPTIAASGLPGYEWGQANAMFAPAKTAPAIIRRLNEETTRFLQTAEAKERLLSNGLEPIGSSPEQLAVTVKSDLIRVGKVMKDAGIQTQ